jgi:tRNA A-37 threonylcarbamoyl transferase component Bud32
MNSEDIILLLLVYYDILLIIETVHAADIAHFDIKCCNFVLRKESLSIEHMKVSFSF